MSGRKPTIMFSLDQKYLQRLVESSPDMIIAVDSDGIVNYYNDGARTSLHYSGQEMIGGKVLASTRRSKKRGAS